MMARDALDSTREGFPTRVQFPGVVASGPIRHPSPAAALPGEPP